jgi:hypothetical protein
MLRDDHGGRGAAVNVLALFEYNACVNLAERDDDGHNADGHDDDDDNHNVNEQWAGRYYDVQHYRE